jgi:hypothetical protein
MDENLNSTDANTPTADPTPSPSVPFAVLVRVPQASSCVNFTNLGTNNPKLDNSCPHQVTVAVGDYDAAGNKVGERIFHLSARETRPIAFPGNQMGIEWEKGWASDGVDDGSAFLTLTHHTMAGGSVLWEATNNNPSRFNAAQYRVYENGKKTGAAQPILAPGQTLGLYAFLPGDIGFVVLEWSRLDPL